MKTVDGPRLPESSNPLLGISPAKKAISTFLSVHDALPPRSRTARTFGREPLSVESNHWFLGAIGELQVESALKRLGEGWSVLHCVPVEATPANSEPSPIEHLVIGPAGIFTIKTGNHSGHSVWASGRTFIVDGHRMPYIRTAEFEMGHVERVLSAGMGSEWGVSAIVVAVNPSSFSIRDLPRDVYIVTSRRLCRWLEARGRTLDAGQLERVRALASEVGTWAPVEDALVDVVHERERFELIRGEVATARMVRQLWVICGAVLVLGGLVVMGISQLAGLGGAS